MLAKQIGPLVSRREGLQENRFSSELPAVDLHVKNSYSSIAYQAAPFYLSRLPRQTTPTKNQALHSW